jgi:RNA polymerase sigma factor (sigma-70 family)
LVVDEANGLRELYAATHRRLVVAIAGITGDLNEAEDCVAEAFARAIPRWAQISRYEDPEGWVRRVAINVAKSRWRAARRRALAGRHSAAEVAPLSEDHVALLAALRRLPVQQREAIVLHHLAGLAVEEVAIHQQAPVGTIKARLSRGRATLARLLAWDDEEVDSR